jgi:glycosyltransferase involved in cell wall biosynthesis
MVVEGLHRLGSVDVCVVHRERPPEMDLPPPPEVAGAEWVRAADVPLWRWRVLWSSVTPERLARLAPGADHGIFRAPRALTWCVEPRGFEPVRDVVGHPVVLDLQNLHDWKHRHQRGSPGEPWLRKTLYLPRMAAKWTAWQRRAAADVDAMVVCSELDARRVGVDNAVVIPNCYPAPAPPGNRHPNLERLTIAFVGTLQYDPNRVAARFFAREVLPLIRREVPAATFRVVGAKPHLAGDLTDTPGVDVQGHVPDIERALADVDVVVAPIFFGGGTRLKVIEGWARQLPVVSTRVGAEGLDAADGENLLLAETADEFGGAVLRIHRSPELRAALVDGGTRLYEARYMWRLGVDAVERLAVHLTADSAL